MLINMYFGWGMVTCVFFIPNNGFLGKKLVDFVH